MPNDYRLLLPDWYIPGLQPFTYSFVKLGAAVIVIYDGRAPPPLARWQPQW